MTPKCHTFLFEKGGTFWENLLFLGKSNIFGKMFYFWSYVGVPHFAPFLFVHYFRALRIIDTICSIFQFILHLFDANREKKFLEFNSSKNQNLSGQKMVEKFQMVKNDG